ncbi:Deoxyguanosinetriphosphate triphosphohydrolase-like protein [Candidatus Anstonella stagnisolia]|nr:Deoxyguanosinetriphosphate triphosphohydrolase-like protein [Candidatus Anstonella stagnisolia]
MYNIVIKDPVHGSVRLNSIEAKVLDSAPMQRLRNIRQLAMANLVYPGANHTRFEHSVGTLFIAGEMCRNLGLDEDEAAQIRLAALLHDVGHVAFSHEAEVVTREILGTHEQVGQRRILKGEIADILGENFSAKKIAQLIVGKGMGQVVCSDIGADRMDYLLRDSHYTGVAYGVIDSQRICNTCALEKKRFVVGHGGLEAAESLLVGRFMMFAAVYLHHTVRIASRMLQQALSEEIGEGRISEDGLLEMDDGQLLAHLVENKSTLARDLYARRLYKRAHSVPMGELGKEALLAAKSGRLQSVLSQECGCSVLVDVPPQEAREASIRVLLGKRSVPIGEASALVRSLTHAHRARMKLIVCSEKKDVKKVGKIAEREIRRL